MDFSLLMTFVNEIGDKVSLTISNIKQNVTQEEVAAAMAALNGPNFLREAYGVSATHAGRFGSYEEYLSSVGRRN